MKTQSVNLGAPVPADHSRVLQTLSVRAKLLSLALALMTMNQLKFVGGYVGLGEILLLIIVGISLFNPVVATHRMPRSVIISVSLMAFMAVWISASSLFQLIAPAPTHNFVVTDMVTFWAAVLITALVLAALRDLTTTLQVVAWACIITVIANGLLFFACKLTGIQTLGPFQFIMYGVRFQGFSTDPNQLSRICAISPWLIGLEVRNCRKSVRLLLLLALIFSVALGIESESQSCWVAWAAGLVVWLGRSVLNLPTLGRKPELRLIGVLVAACCAAFIILLMVNVLLFDGRGSGLISYFAAEGGLAREQIAQSSMSVIAEAPIIGHGFGQHVPWITPRASILYMESHDVLLDFLVRGGIIAAALFLAFLGLAGFGVVRSGSPLLSALLASSLIFSMSITPIRQPLFWLTMVTCAAGGVAIRKRGSRPAEVTTHKLGADRQSFRRPKPAFN